MSKHRRFTIVNNESLVTLVNNIHLSPAGIFTIPIHRMFILVKIAVRSYIMLKNKTGQQLVCYPAEIQYVVSSLFSLPRYRFSYLGELLGRQLELFGPEIDVLFAVHRYQVDMCMRYFESQHYHCNLFAS